jgi:hypothetical protein
MALDAVRTGSSPRKILESVDIDARQCSSAGATIRLLPANNVTMGVVEVRQGPRRQAGVCFESPRL